MIHLVTTPSMILQLSALFKNSSMESSDLCSHSQSFHSFFNKALAAWQWTRRQVISFVWDTLVNAWTNASFGIPLNNNSWFFLENCSWPVCPRHSPLKFHFVNQWNTMIFHGGTTRSFSSAIPSCWNCLWLFNCFSWKTACASLSLDLALFDKNMANNLPCKFAMQKGLSGFKQQRNCTDEDEKLHVLPWPCAFLSLNCKQSCLQVCNEKENLPRRSSEHKWIIFPKMKTRLLERKVDPMNANGVCSALAADHFKFCFVNQIWLHLLAQRFCWFTGAKRKDTTLLCQLHCWTHWFFSLFASG